MLNLTMPREWLEQDPGGWRDCLREAEAALTRLKAGEPEHASSLGWLRLDRWAGEEHLDRALAQAAEMREKADLFVLIGVGGSNNAARSVIGALEPREGAEVLYAGNTLSPWAVNRVLERMAGRSPCLCCIAKNFQTLEPGAAFRLLRQALAERYGAAGAAERILCIGSAGSPLEALCARHRYAFLPFPHDVGGRYSAFSYVGLLPMAAAGVDIRALVRGGREMEALLWEAPAPENPAVLYAALRAWLWRRGYRLELLSSFEPRFRWFYRWWEQLFAESEGKEGKGIFPVTGEFSEELHSLGQFIQEGTPLLYETFLEVRDPGPGDSLLFPPDHRVEDGFSYLDGMDLWAVNRTAFEATRRAHGQRLPCLTLTLDRLDEAAFGELFYFFQFACRLSCGLAGVNPFDQPGVEAYKERMFRALGK